MESTNFNINNSSLINTDIKKSRFKFYINLIIYTILIAILLRMFFIEAVRVPTNSMANTLMNGDYVVVDKFSYGIRTPKFFPFSKYRIPQLILPAIRKLQRGDVIVFYHPADIDQSKSKEIIKYVKRCVAVAGDTLRIVNNILYINGSPLTIISNNSYADSKLQPDYLSMANFGPIVVPQKGDVIHLSMQNFALWKTFIEREGNHVYSDKMNVIFIDGYRTNKYTVEQNYLFVLGDNYNQSLDSRHWGFLSEKNLIGKAVIIYWSFEPSISQLDFIDRLEKIRWGRIFKIVQ